MNAYLEYAEILEWKVKPIAWINHAYTAYLISKLEIYRNYGGINSQELNVLCSQFNETELKNFVSYPFVADLLHPRTKLHTDEDIWPIQAYALSYLTWLEKLPSEYAIHEAPDGLRQPIDSFPLENRISKKLPVSFVSNLIFPGMDRGGNDLHILDAEKIALETIRISKAQELIMKWSPQTWNFVAIGTELLAVRGESSEPNKFGSASFRGLAGLNLLINPNTTTLTIIIEAIVHEAIHSLLYQLEPSFGDFFPEKSNAKTPVKSPWTGTTITLDNISQACYVWFGLFNFWNKASEFDKIDREAGVALNNMIKIASGFESLDIAMLKENINSDMYNAINYMKARTSEYNYR